MVFVLDACVAASWALADENHAHAALALSRIQTDTAETPALWWYELRNILIVSERRGRIGEAQTRAFLDKLSRLPILLDRAPSEAQVLSSARRHGLSVYDAAYLELALRKGLDLATLDARLAHAARAESVRVIGLDT